MKFKISKSYIILISVLTLIAIVLSVSGCANGQTSSDISGATVSEAAASEATTALASGASKTHLAEKDITVNETLNNAESGGHAGEIRRL